MTTTAENFMPATAEAPSNNQRLFVRYLMGALIDLVILNLFVEYSGRVHVDSFTVSLIAAVLLQALLQATIAVEHWVASFFRNTKGAFWTFMRFFCAWLVLFGSKFVILEALALALGDGLRFEGILHGIVTLIVVVVVMLIVEELMVRIYRRLG